MLRVLRVWRVLRGLRVRRKLRKLRHWALQPHVQNRLVGERREGSQSARGDAGAWNLRRGIGHRSVRFWARAVRTWSRSVHAAERRGRLEHPKRLRYITAAPLQHLKA
eukprot:4429599-Prymnesium_polylepis.1